MDSRPDVVGRETEEFQVVLGELGADIHVGGGFGAFPHRRWRVYRLSGLRKARGRAGLGGKHRLF